MHTKEIRDLRPESGETLMEILVSVVILSIGIYGLVSALVSTTAAANRLKGRSQVSVAVTHLADAIQRTSWKCNTASPEMGYLPDITPLFSDPNLNLNSAWTISVLSVKYWGHGNTLAFGPTVGSACPPIVSPPTETLLLNVRVTAPGNRGSQTFDVVKRPLS
jgi:type II secretory pathway pseudopilin PulG